jgi:hypothetical protein
MFVKNQILPFDLKKISLTLLSILVFLTSACSSAPSKKVSAEFVTLNKTRLKEFYWGPFQHPAKMTLQEASSLLESIHYIRNQVVWGKPQRLFPKSLVGKIAPIIQKGFSRASSRQAVKFKIRFTQFKADGEVFLNKKGFNIKVSYFSNKSQPLTDTGIWDQNWKLVLKKGQFFPRKPGLLGQNDIDRKWIIIPKVKFKKITKG